MSNANQNYAVRVFQHYIALALRSARHPVDGDVYAEIEAAVDSLIRAAVQEAVRRMEEEQS